MKKVLDNTVVCSNFDDDYFYFKLLFCKKCPCAHCQNRLKEINNSFSFSNKKFIKTKTLKKKIK